jgi:RNA polymerase sigma-70 factor, ECF subfamily
MDFDTLYKQYSPKVYRICLAYVNDPEHARDLLQETFINVWESLSYFRGDAHISTWIFRIATNNCLRDVQKQKRFKMISLPTEITMVHEPSKEEDLNRLQQCISELEENDRLLISLVLEDLPQAEIASILGLSEINTRVKIHRVKEKLSKKFKRHGQL